MARLLYRFTDNSDIPTTHIQAINLYTPESMAVTQYRIIAAITGKPESANISFPTISQFFALRIKTPRILSIMRRKTTVKVTL